MTPAAPPPRRRHSRSNSSLESQIATRITTDGSVIVPPRIARWLVKHADISADRRIRVRDTDPDAYTVLAALHLAALRSDCGPKDAGTQPYDTQSNPWMSTSEAAKTHGVTDRCIRRWCQTGRLNAVMSGSRWLIHRTNPTPHQPHTTENHT